MTVVTWRSADVDSSFADATRVSEFATASLAKVYLWSVSRSVRSFHQAVRGRVLRHPGNAPCRMAATGSIYKCHGDVWLQSRGCGQLPSSALVHGKTLWPYA